MSPGSLVIRPAETGRRATGRSQRRQRFKMAGFACLLVFCVSASITTNCFAVLPSDPLTDPGHDDLVPVVVLQEDGVPSTDTWALWNGSFPDLSSMALCMWVQASYWRLSGTVFSYAVDDLIDNGIMLNIRQNSIALVYYNEEVLMHIRKNPLLRWTHLCLVASDSGFQLYLDGVAVPNHLVAARGKKWKAKQGLEGGGTLVLGQDQDTPGDGFSASDSFSGLIADLQVFNKVLTQDDITAAAHCRKAIPNALITFLNNDWIFNNVTRRSVNREEFCRNNQEQFFLVFHQTVNLETHRQLCSAIGGHVPHENSTREIFMSLMEYAMNWYANFIKLHTRIISTNFDCEQLGMFTTFAFLWRPGENSSYSIDCKLDYAGGNYFMCDIRRETVYRLNGLPENIQDQVDSHYLLYRNHGHHLLRGISKSYIQHSGDRWCLYAIQKEGPFYCYLSNSDYPPVGRRQWNASKLLLTICDRSQFTCDSGNCVEINKRCDMHADCEDKSDESECSVVKANHRNVKSMASIPLSPLLVAGNIKISSIPEIDISRSVFAMRLLVGLTWEDERLYLYNVRELSVIKKEHFWAWHPHVQPVPAKMGETPKSTVFIVRRKCPGQPTLCSITEENEFSPNCSEVTMESDYQVDWYCNFDLRNFPFETVLCNITLYLTSYQLWDKDNIAFNMPQTDNLQYCVSLKGMAVNDSQLTFTLAFKRQFGGYLVTTFIPIAVVSFLAALSFLFDPEDFTNRVMVTLSCFIVVASLFSQVSASLPPTSYVKLVDIVFLATIFLLSVVFASHVTFALRRRSGDKGGKKPFVVQVGPRKM